MDHFNTGNCQFIDEDFVEAVEVHLYILCSFVLTATLYCSQPMFYAGS